jgi:hypothetical protein
VSMDCVKLVGYLRCSFGMVFPFDIRIARRFRSNKTSA